MYIFLKSYSDKNVVLNCTPYLTRITRRTCHIVVNLGQTNISFTSCLHGQRLYHTFKKLFQQVYLKSKVLPIENSQRLQ